MPEAIPVPPSAERLERRRIINDTTIRSLKPPPSERIEYFDDLTPGLSLRVTAKNARMWTIFYRNKNGRQKRLTLGRHPAVKLVDARELAREAQRKVAHGGVPVADKRAARDVLTFGALAKEYIDSYAKPKNGVGARTSVSSTPACCRSGRHVRRPKFRPRTYGRTQRQGQGWRTGGGESAACAGLADLYVRSGAAARSADGEPP